MTISKIEWCTHTENYQAGCSKVSPACRHCYAATMSVRLANMGQDHYSTATNGDLRNPVWTGIIKSDLDKMAAIFGELQRARKPRRVFLGSMTDLFHKDVEEAVLSALAIHLSAVPNRHQILLLTKRPQRLLDWQKACFPDGLPETVWVGVTAETQRNLDERASVLLLVKAHTRFLSMEPMLEPINLETVINTCGCGRCNYCWDFHGGERGPGIHWVIVGGESHSSPAKARPTEPTWIADVIRQCREADIAPFVKQLGANWARHTLDAHRVPVYNTDRKGEHPDRWPADLRVREFPGGGA